MLKTRASCWHGIKGLAGTSVLARGRFDGANTLTDVEDIFVSDARVSGFSVARLIFAPDGKIFMSIGMPLRDQEHGGSNRIGTAEQSQEPGSHAGKILRLNDDGTERQVHMRVLVRVAEPPAVEQDDVVQQAAVPLGVDRSFSRK